MLNLQKFKKVLYFIFFVVCISSGFLYFTAKKSLPEFPNAKIISYTSKNKVTDLYNEKIKDQNGKEILISDFKGKFIIIAITTTWCHYCPQALKYLNELAQLNLQNIKIISLIASSKDEPLTPNAVKIHYFAHDITYLDPYYSVDEESFFQKYVKSVPTFFIFTPAGKLLGSYLGYPNFSSKKFLNFIKNC